MSLSDLGGGIYFSRLQLRSNCCRYTVLKCFGGCWDDFIIFTCSVREFYRRKGCWKKTYLLSQRSWKNVCFGFFLACYNSLVAINGSCPVSKGSKEGHTGLHNAGDNGGIRGVGNRLEIASDQTCSISKQRGEICIRRVKCL